MLYDYTTLDWIISFLPHRPLTKRLSPSATPRRSARNIRAKDLLLFQDICRMFLFAVRRLNHLRDAHRLKWKQNNKQLTSPASSSRPGSVKDNNIASVTFQCAYPDVKRGRSRTNHLHLLQIDAFQYLSHSGCDRRIHVLWIEAKNPPVHAFGSVGI